MTYYYYYEGAQDSPMLGVLPEMRQQKESEVLDAEFDFNDAVGAVQDGAAHPSSAAFALMTRLTDNERIDLLADAEDIDKNTARLGSDQRDGYVHSGLKRLRIPSVRFCGGPCGCDAPTSTEFLPPVGRGATWDVNLEEQIGNAIGRECRGHGFNLFGGLCATAPSSNTVDHTSYGSDPHLLEEFGSAMTKGLQRHVMVCASHALPPLGPDAAYKRARNIHEVSLATLRRLVEEGAAAIKISYDFEEWSAEHTLLLQVLRRQWRFEGFAVSGSLTPLLDAADHEHEATFRTKEIQKKGIKGALQQGIITQNDIESAGIAILGRQIENAARREVEEPRLDDVSLRTHRALAQEAATRSIVLLMNETKDGKAFLPLEEHGSTFALLRRAEVITGARLSTQYSTLVAGFITAGVPVTLGDLEDEDPEVKHARSADVPIVIIGEDVEQLEEDIAIAEEIARANPRTIFCVKHEAIYGIEHWKHLPAAILCLWSSTFESGKALADIIFGKHSPAGRLPFPIHNTNMDQQQGIMQLQISPFDETPSRPVFQLGYGLTYTSFALSALDVQDDVKSDYLRITITIRNTGPCQGRYILQIYGSSIDHLGLAHSVLLGFEAVDLQAQRMKQLQMNVSTRPLKELVESLDSPTQPKKLKIEVGSYLGHEENIEREIFMS